MQIRYKRLLYEVKEGENLLSFIFSINQNINKKQFCTKGQCRKCYSTIMDSGSYHTREVLSCQTAIYSPIRIVALPKILAFN